MKFQGLAGVLMVAVLCSTAGRAFADPPPWAHAHAQESNPFVEGGSYRDRGTLRGEIVSLDYGRSRIVVKTPEGRRDVTILPTTSIFHGGDEASLSDLQEGMRVEISVSELAGHFVAQIIRIKGNDGNGKGNDRD